MSDSDLLAFEERFGIAHAQQIREFLLRIGNGASGPPAYGLVKLDPVSGPVNYRSHARELARMQNVFPFTKPWMWEGGDASDEGTATNFRMGGSTWGKMGAAWIGF